MPITAPRNPFEPCAALIREADALIIGAGAGIGVDSGLPDFRGEHGFWKAYPALGRAQISFHEIACPDAFEKNPRLAWGFYGHRLQLYRETVPHEGFAILREIVATLPQGTFVFTSNVDGQFHKAGFDAARIVECHGSIHYLQCLDACTPEIWPADEFEPEIDADQCRLVSDLPRCPACGGLARPNVLMFGDWHWLQMREMRQAKALAQWAGRVERPVVIELGAGTDIPSVRAFCERQRRPLIRINPREPGLGNRAGVGLAMGALEAMRGIREALFV
jgi:NAD-dependent SIR2 family protein deacetylase